MKAGIISEPLKRNQPDRGHAIAQLAGWGATERPPEGPYGYPCLLPSPTQLLASMLGVQSRLPCLSVTESAPSRLGHADRGSPISERYEMGFEGVWNVFMALLPSNTTKEGEYHTRGVLAALRKGFNKKEEK